MQTTKTTNPHAWFFAYLKIVDGWGQGFDEVIKESIIFDYSGGKTESLKELFEKYPTKYRKMRAELSTSPSPSKRGEFDERLDKARKKLIAAIFSNLEGRGYKPTMDYVKAVACKGAKVTRFNDIALPTLKDLYNRFRNKDLQASVNELLKTIDI
jgi:hypothetical protein